MRGCSSGEYVTQRCIASSFSYEAATSRPHHTHPLKPHSCSKFMDSLTTLSGVVGALVALPRKRNALNQQHLLPAPFQFRHYASEYIYIFRQRPQPSSLPKCNDTRWPSINAQSHTHTASSRLPGYNLMRAAKFTAPGVFGYGAGEANNCA